MPAYLKELRSGYWSVISCGGNSRTPGHPSARPEADDGLAEGHEIAPVLAVDVGHGLISLPPQRGDLALEPVDFVPGAVQLLLQGDDPLDAGQAHAFGGQLLDPLQAVD